MKWGLVAIMTLALAGGIGLSTRPWRWTEAGTAWSSGPTVEHLESLSELVCLRVHIADVLVGENDDYRGAWLIRGDAVLATDLKRAQILVSDSSARRAQLRLVKPVVGSPRVDHERTRTWSVEKTTWIPFKGNPDHLRDAAMREAQRKIQEAAGSTDNVLLAQRTAEKVIRELYRMVDWDVDVDWGPPGP